MGRSKRYKNEAKEEEVSIDEPERVVQAKTLKRPPSKKEENIRIIAQSHAVRITEAHKTLDCVNAAICRRPDLTIQYSNPPNPPKRLKRIEDEKCIRRVPQPDLKDERLENIYSATIKSIYIPMLQIPANGKIREVIFTHTRRNENLSCTWQDPDF
jgi:hypothetical protein